MTKTKSTTKKTKRARTNSKEPHGYREPKTAAELGITCAAVADGQQCGASALWFDYELGEKSFLSGFVCDAHKVSNRFEKLAIKPAIAIAAA